MEYTEEEYNRVISQKSIFDDIVLQSVNEVKDNIRETIKIRWSEGESVNGGKILNKSTGKGYSQLAYKNMKLMKNPKASGDVDLTLTGALGDAITLIATTSGDYEIISEDSKYLEIGNKYGFDEFGLNNEEMIFYMKLLEDSINNKLLNL